MNIVEWREYFSEFSSDKLTSNARLVAHTLALFYRTGNLTFPGQELLTARAGIAPNTLTRGIEELVKVGLIKAIKVVPKGKRTGKYYYIFMGVEDSEIQGARLGDVGVIKGFMGEPSTIEPSTIEPSTIEPSTIEPSTIEPSTIEPSTIEPSTIEPSTIEPSTIEPFTKPSMAKPSVVEGKVENNKIKKEKEREGKNSPSPDLENLDLKKDNPKWYQYMKAKHGVMNDSQINISYGVFLSTYPPEKWTWPLWLKWVEMEKPEKYPASAPIMKESKYKLDDTYEATLDKTFQRVRSELRKKHGDAIFVNWLSHMKLIEVKNNICYLSTPTLFIKQTITAQYLNSLIEIWQKIEPGVKLIELAVSKKERIHAN